MYFPLFIFAIAAFTPNKVSALFTNLLALLEVLLLLHEITMKVKQYKGSNFFKMLSNTQQKYDH